MLSGRGRGSVIEKLGRYREPSLRRGQVQPSASWAFGSDTNHPDQQHQEDQEDDGSGDSSSNVGKL